jgi:hypothetical protein
MIPLSRERRHGQRRADARGGRRATDRAGSSITAQSCPFCGSVANEVGESDGGWWFVCESCDHLWNERERAGRAAPKIEAFVEGESDGRASDAERKVKMLAETPRNPPPPRAHKSV